MAGHLIVIEGNGFGAGQYVRRVGRPQNKLAVMFHKESCKMGVGLNRSIHIQQEWREAV